jgi:hypothetical protein
MQDAKPTTLFFFLLTAYCPLPTAHCPLPTRDQQLLPRSQPRSCTLVDICWKRIGKVSLCLTFRPARSGFPMASLDSQVALSQRDRVCQVDFSGKETPCGTSNPKVSYRSPLIVHYLKAKSPSQILLPRQGMAVI